MSYVCLPAFHLGRVFSARFARVSIAWRQDMSGRSFAHRFVANVALGKVHKICVICLDFSHRTFCAPDSLNGRSIGTTRRGNAVRSSVLPLDDQRNSLHLMCSAEPGSPKSLFETICSAWPVPGFVAAKAGPLKLPVLRCAWACRATRTVCAAWAHLCAVRAACWCAAKQQMNIRERGVEMQQG